MSTQGKPKALITGGTRGIGKSIAEKLISEDYFVTITGTSSEKRGPKDAEYVELDFNDREKFEKVLLQIKETGFDILVNNAGINRLSGIQELEINDFTDLQNVNVLGPVQLIQAVVPYMKATSWGRIVNIGSIWGKLSRTGRISYSASKFALDGITASVSAELAKFGILINTVSPGFIDTELTREILSTDEILNLEKQIPIGRLGQPNEIASLVYWMCSEENSYISGQNIIVDGGFSRV